MSQKNEFVPKSWPEDNEASLNFVLWSAGHQFPSKQLEKIKNELKCRTEFQITYEHL